MEITDIKQHLDIIETAEHLGLKIDTRTKKALCPFHNDKTPSLQFSKDKQICTCFSSNCRAGTMDIIKLTEKKLQLSTHEALKYLSGLAGETPNGNGNGNENETPARETKEPKAYKDLATLKKVFASFEGSFLASKPAKEYAKTRKLDIKRLVIGYNAGTFHHGENKYLIESSEQLGLLLPKNNSGGNPVFALASLVFALRNPKGEVTGLYFRAVEPRPRKFAKKPYEKHLYLKNRSGLYPHYPKADTKHLILTESVIDAATLLSIPEVASNYEVLALYGTNGLTTEHTGAIKELKELEEVILFFDGDEAGEKAREKHGETLRKVLANEIRISEVKTPSGTDVNELAQGHDAKVFTQLLKEREPYTPVGGQVLSSIETTSVESSNENKKAVQPDAPPAANPPLSHSLDTTNPNKITYQSDTASYAIKGGVRKDLDSLKVTLEIRNQDGYKLRDKVELYEYKQIERYARAAAEKLSLRSDLLESDLNYLTDLLDDYRETLHEQHQKEKVTPHIMPQQEREKLQSFGRRKTLIKDINTLIGKSGIVGEEKGRLVLFVVASAYKMPETLHALIQGSTGSGKSHVMEAVVNLMPKEDVYWFTRVTESSLYNYGSDELKGKILAFEDWDGLEEKAEYAVRELISKGKITSSTSGKDEQTGNIKAFHHTVYGPVTTFACTTRGHIYEDNMNRVFVIAVDESKEQTERVITYQNEKDAGEIDPTEEKRSREQLQNFMRILTPCNVVNPYAGKINLPSEADNLRRLNRLFKAFVKQITVLHQYQRTKDKQGRLITEKEDIRTAIDILFDSIVLKVDELDGSLRLFYEKLKAYVLKKGKDYEFSRREIRQALGISKTQQHAYMTQLLELEYLHQIGGYSNRGFTYKVIYWDDNAAMRGKIKTYLDNQLDKL